MRSGLQYVYVQAGTGVSEDGNRVSGTALGRLQVIEALYNEEAKAAGKIKTFVCA